MNEQELLRRAFAAYFRTSTDSSPDQPSGSGSEVVFENKKPRYVVLRGGRGRGPLAVYRVKNDGILRRMKRWPKDIE